MDFKIVSNKGVETLFRSACAAFAYWETQSWSGAKYKIRVKGRWKDAGM